MNKPVSFFASLNLPAPANRNADHAKKDRLAPPICQYHKDILHKKESHNCHLFPDQGFFQKQAGKEGNKPTHEKNQESLLVSR